MVISDLIFDLLKYLSLTLLIELIIALLIKINDKRDLLRIVLINCITNPIVNILDIVIIYYFYPSFTFHTIYVIVLELIVCLVEFLYYDKHLKYRKIHPLMVSIILNVASFVVGLFF
jgi:hypothetical protein